MIENSPPEAKKIEMTQPLPVQRQQQYCMVILYFLRMSFCSGSHALTVQRQACFFEHEWGLLLVLCAYGVYRVRVVVLGACQVGLALCTFEWRWAILFVKSLLLGACQVAT